MKNLDPHCYEHSSSADECCSTVLCDNDAEVVDLGKLVNQEIVGSEMTGQCAETDDVMGGGQQAGSVQD